MLASVAGFEFRQQLKAPVFWIAGLLFLLFSFTFVTTDVLQVGGMGPVKKNAPYAIELISLTMGVFYMFVTTAFVAGVVVRDDETGFGPILRSTRITKGAYLYGRFAGAFAAAALGFLFVPLGLFLGSLAPWVDREKLAPFLPGSYVYAYLVWGLPTAFVTGALLFALATATRSMMATYLGVVSVLVLWIVTQTVVRQLGLQGVAPYLDPFGAGAFSAATRYASTAEKNTLTSGFSPALVQARLLWIGVGVAALAAAYALYRTEARSPRRRRGEARAQEAAGAPAPVVAAPSTAARARPRHDRGAALAQFALRTRFEASLVLRSPALLVLLAVGLINALAGLWLSDGAIYGSPLHPMTRIMITGLRGSFAAIPLIVAVYYAGELVWRDKDRRLEEIVGSTPAPDWSFAFPKMVAISLVLLALMLVGVLAGVVVQLGKGGAAPDVAEYLGWFVAPQTLLAVQLAVLAVFLQTIAPHKFVGWGLMLGVLVLQMIADGLGLDHNLYLYANTPSEPLSDMNGAGVFGVAGWWFRAYWTAVALALALLSYGLWRRGAQTALRPRLTRLPRRLGRGGALALGLAAATAVALGVFIFVNTDVWNLHHTRQDDEKRLVAMERALGRYADLPQPKITAVSLNVDIRPEELSAVTRGSYLIVNDSAAPIRDLHLQFARFLKIKGLSVEGGRPSQTYERFDHRVFAFDTPMAPGETRRVSFETRLSQRGFRNSDNIREVAGNGTFLLIDRIAPTLGVNRRGFLQDRDKRRRFHLTPIDIRPPKLEDEAARRFNALRRDADFIRSDVTVSTDADQTPMAPGYRTQDVTQEGRRTARFVSEAPFLPVIAVQSARYAEARDRWRDVELSVLHDPKHAWNVRRMLDVLKAGLEYDTAAFGPYQFRQMRIVEFPDYAQFAISLPNTVPYSEGIGFVLKPPADPRASDKIDMVTYVTAHELAHQWWAHQETPSDQQGAAAVTETLSQYTALMLMERLYGPDQIRRFLKYELDRYLRGRGTDNRDELPLARVENQPYIHYSKGSLVMYRLKDELGEATVNRALRRFLEAFKLKGPPFARSTDLLRILREEAGPDPRRQALITDLFERIVLYDLKTSAATAVRRPDGRYDVTLRISARKLGADGKGAERVQPMEEAVDVGVFAAKPGAAGFAARDVLSFQRVTVRAGEQTVKVTVDRAPRFAGVDPYNKLIDRNAEDNTAAVPAVR